MNAASKRALATTVTRRPELPAEGPLKFDFNLSLAPRGDARPGKATSIKEAVLRWLDEQL